MQTRERIEIDFKRALYSANTLTEAAGQLGHAAEIQLENVQQHAGLGWKGESADLFQVKCNALSEEIKDTAKAMRHVAFSIQIAAEVMYRAEMNALQMVTVKS